jgi:hypothetical protein
MTVPHAVTLKFIRAREHVKALETAIDTFLRDEPVVAARFVKGNGNEHVWAFTKYADAPESFGLIVGDAIHNLRSSLDHLTVALAEAGAKAIGVTMTSEDEAGLQFPIVPTDRGFANQVQRGRLKFIESTAQTFIKNAQPHKICPQNPDSAILAIVGRLDNTDKHRQINTAANVVTVIRVNWPASLRDSLTLQPHLLEGVPLVVGFR